MAAPATSQFVQGAGVSPASGNSSRASAQAASARQNSSAPSGTIHEPADSVKKADRFSVTTAQNPACAP